MGRDGRGGERDEADPWSTPAVTVERERLADGRVVGSATVFLIGAECRFSCVFCDLWRHTLDGPTPPGAIPAQLRAALASLERDGVRPAQLKLYNASNYFDERAVPEADDGAVGELVAGVARVVVECHPKLVGARCFAVAERWRPRLQVAMGLETVHPGAARRLRKGCLPADFARSAEALRARGIGVRAFVLLGVPFVPEEETVEWAVRSVAFAGEAGAEHVTIIPLRGGEVELDELEESLDRGVGLAPVVTADLWDVEALAGACPDCRAARLARLARVNAEGRAEPRLPSCRCDHAPPWGRRAPARLRSGRGRRAPARLPAPSE